MLLYPHGRNPAFKEFAGRQAQARFSFLIPLWALSHPPSPSCPGPSGDAVRPEAARNRSWVRLYLHHYPHVFFARLRQTYDC